MSRKEQLGDLSKNLEKIADVAIDYAGSKNIDRIKIHTKASFSNKLVAETGELSLANSLESQSLALAVHSGQKKGSSQVNSTDEAVIKQAVDDALALATYSVVDDNLTMATAEDAPRTKPLDFMFDDKLAETSLTDLHGIMAEALARVIRDKRVALDRYEMSLNVSSHGLYTSTGVRQSESQTMCQYFCFGMAREGEQVTGFDYDGGFSYGFDSILDGAMKSAERFEQTVIGLLNPKAGPTYKGAVMFTPRAVQEILLGTILFHQNGRQVMDGKSKWEKEVGNKVISDLWTIRDTPHDPRFSGCTTFDGDGLPTRDHTLFDKGVLTMLTHDCYSAKKMGTKSTATNGGPFAMSVGAGNQPLQDLLKQVDDLLVVDRFSGNTDPIKGDFSGVAKASRHFVKGEDQGPVTETMIAGNVLDAVNAVIGMSQETRMEFGAFESPWVLCDGISVSSGS